MIKKKLKINIAIIIFVLSCADDSIIKEIIPSEWIYIAKWKSADKLLYYESSGFDVSGFYEYYIQQDAINQMEYMKGSMSVNADYHKDGTLMSFVNTSGLGNEFTYNLHLVDVKLNTDTTVVKKNSIIDPKISHNKKHIAFFEVEWNRDTSRE